MLAIYSGLFIIALYIIAKDLIGDALNRPRYYSLKKYMEQQVQCITIYIKSEYLYINICLYMLNSLWWDIQAIDNTNSL